MKYIELFETSAAFENFTLDESNTPNVSLIEELSNTPDGGLVYTKKILPQLHDYSLDYFTLVAIDDCYFTFTANAYEEGAGLSFSTDNGETWSEYINYESAAQYVIHITPGNKVLFKGRNVEFGGSCGSEPVFSVAYTDENNNTIETPQRFYVEGNITSLVYGDDFNGQTIIGEDDDFNALFSKNENLVSAENLVLPTNVTRNCYSDMFLDCTSLTTAPVLPATILSEDCCYYQMFSGCISLNSVTCLATDITADECTYNMFYGCLHPGTFIKAPSMTGWTVGGEEGIPANWTIQDYGVNTNYANNYFTLFAIDDCLFEYSCPADGYLSYSLDNGTTWSEPAQSKTDENYISVLALQKVLFKGNINVSVRSMYGATQSFHSKNSGRYYVEGNIMSLLYGDNFIGQTNLSDMEGVFLSLFYGESTLLNAKNLILPATTLSQHCYKYMFHNCTSLAAAPELPATILANYCYYGMFEGCTSLTFAPELPATILTDYCYRTMFKNCSNLQYVKCLATSYVNFSTTDWLDGVYFDGTFIKAPSMIGWPEGTNGIPSGWTVQNAE